MAQAAQRIPRKHELASEKHACPFCRTVAIPSAVSETEQILGSAALRAVQCASCDKIAFSVVKPLRSVPITLTQVISFGRGARVYKHVPAHLIADYSEASKVLFTSPKSSAAMARRCLQGVLRKQGYSGPDLAKQIDAVLAETDRDKVLPRQLRENVDAIRNYGNFGAHPIDDKTTLQVIDVEDGEAEWSLELIEELFSIYYEEPGIAEERRVQLSEKLVAAGKPPLKAKRQPENA